MIGPVEDYRSMYTTACGRTYGSFAGGVDHERECPECQAQIQRDTSQDREPPKGLEGVIEAARCVVCTAFGNTTGLSESEQLIALRTACRSLRVELKAAGY